MKPVAVFVGIFVFGLSFVSAQTLTPAPAKALPVTSTPAKPSPETLQLQALTKTIEAQNAKIDILSQQILKLEQQLTHMRPGIMIGESDRAPAAPSAPVATPIPRQPGIANHTVARGETLTSIAKLYGVSVSELQHFNRIEDPLKLRAGQALMIPPPTTPAASSPSE